MKYIFLLMLFFISSCGFQAIYKSNDKISDSDNMNYMQDLASIEIKKSSVHKHIDQQFKNDLQDALNPDGIKVDTKYLLITDLVKTLTSTFTTMTGASGRNQVILTATFSLKDLNSGNIISSGDVMAKDDFDVQDKRFGNYIAQETIELNLTKILAKNIRDLIIKDIAENNDGEAILEN